MFTNDELNREFIFVTSRNRLIASPPASEDIKSMRQWCGKIRRLETTARKWLFACMFLAPMLVSSFFVSWSTLILILLIAVALYSAIVFVLPHAIKLFVKVSFKVNQAEMIDPMNETLFGTLQSPLREFAQHSDAIQYCKNLDKLNRDATVFDKYIVFMLNESESAAGTMLKSELNA
jgi:hypothetical protein